MAPNDRRVRRTRRALREALVALTSLGPYEAITIRDITDRADVGYATFFRHYAGKDDLLLELFQDVTRELEALAREHGGEFFQTEGRLIFGHVRDHQALYRSLLESRLFTQKLKKLLSEHIRRQVARHRRPRARAGLMEDIAVNHMVAALVGLIEWWLERNLEPPAEQMAGIYERLIIQATWQALLDGPPPTEPQRDNIS